MNMPGRCQVSTRPWRCDCDLCRNEHVRTIADFHGDRLTAQVSALKAALRDVLGWYEHSDVRDLIGRKHGEQADYHRKLNAARSALADVSTTP